MKLKKILSMLLVLVMVFGMLPVSTFAVEIGTGYDIVTGDTDSGGGQRVRVKNINISGVEVLKHQKTGDFSATVLLPADTDKGAELTFTLDCVGTSNITMGKIFVNNSAVGSMTANDGSTTDGVWTYSLVPEWDESGEAALAFKSQWDTISWVSKTYTLNLRILGDENTAPSLKNSNENNITELIAVGESYELKLTEAALWEDRELDDMTYTVSVNDAEPVEASATWYQFGPDTAGDYTLVFRAKDSAGNESADTYTVNITAMDLTKFETGGTAVDSWNVDINRIDMGLADVDEVILSDEEGVYAYAILDSETDRDDKLFFRVKASARAGRFADIYINGKSIEGKTVDSTNFMWSAEYTPEWNEYGEASLTFMGRTPNSDSKYQYTIKLKIANADNQAPAFADGGTATGNVEQYFDYTVDVAGLFTGVDDSWLSYSVSVDNGETYEACGDSYTITPKTTDTVTLKFKAKDIFGTESEEFEFTLNVSEYKINEGCFAINKQTDNGSLLSLAIKDAEGNLIDGVKYEMTTEQKTKSYDSGSFAGMTFEWDETTIKVGLPETVGVSDKVVAHWHMVQNEAGLPFLSTADFYRDAVYNTKDGVATTLNGGVGSSTVRFYDDAEVTYEDCEFADRYIVEYYIDRGENNKAPKLKEGVKDYDEIIINQYDTFKVDLSTIFEEPDGDAVTYTVKIDGETKTIGKDYSLDLTSDEDHVIVFKATDPMGAICTYVVDLTVNTVHRHSIETGETGHWARGGVITAIIIDGPETEDSAYVKTDDTHRVVYVQLKDTVADNAEITINWVNNGENGVNLNPVNPIKLVDGEATAEIETTGNFFFKTRYYYTIHISNKANNLPVLAENVPAEIEEEHLVGTAYELDLSTIFTDADSDALTYTVSVNGGEAVAADAAYTYTQGTTGDYVLVFHAKDAWGASETSYTVNLKIKNSDTTFDAVVAVPDAITPTFYAFARYDENGQDLYGDQLTAVAGESADGWTSYTVAVPDNLTRISIRGTDGTNDWGGMSIAVSEGMESVKLRQVNAIINTKIDSDSGKVAPSSEQAIFKVKYGENQYAVNGGSFNDQYGNLAYRFLLIAADNDLVYTYYAVPTGDIAGSYMTNEGSTKTITTDVSTVATTTLPLALKNSLTITAPTEATVVMYRQAGYFNYNAIPVAQTVNNGDGTKKVIFNNVANSSIYRVSMPGEITKAGYTYSGMSEITINWDDDDRGHDYRAEYDTSTLIGSRGDDSMYVNVNYRNNLQLDVHETFQLRAYRIWEIINTDTNNIMIEPDFHYEIISGDDVIDISPTDDVGGIAGQSWLDITAKKAGTAVLEVTYDAIEIQASGTPTSSFGNFEEGATFNASDPARTALVVVQVGDAQNDINFGFHINRTEGWDVEFDTLYFTGEKGQMQLKPTVISGEGTVAKVEVSGNKGNTYTVLNADEDGYYTADIVSGNNIIRVTKDDGSEHYQIVRGDKINVVISEVEGYSDQDGIIDAGEQINVQFKGVHNVIGKMSGIYNPAGYKTNFTFNGETVSGDGGQYTYPHAAYVKVTIPGNAATDTEYTLTNGNTTNGGWGSAASAHRAVSGEVPPGLNAGTVSGSGRNVFPEVTLTVGASIENETIDVESVDIDEADASVKVGKSITLKATVSPVDATNKNITWSSSNTSVASVSESGKVSGVSEGTAVITAKIGEVSDTCTVTVTKDSGSGGNNGNESDSKFGLSGDEIEGYVTISFVDKGKRRSDELNSIDSEYRSQLGTIISSTRVPFKAYDTIASVTLRLLKEKGFTADYEGDEYSNFYLAAIGDFTAKGKYYESFGEFDAGKDSGWMITWDDWFINKGASEFMVKDGDVIKWQYTCQLGADIGDTDWQGSSNSSPSKNNNDKDENKEETKKEDTEVQEKPAFTETTFADIKKDDWHYESVKYVYENNLMEGTGNGFEPESKMTRAMLVTVLYRMANPEEKANNHNFADVPEGQWYSDAVSWAADNNIVKGVSENKFAPDEDITREQLALIIYRYAKIQGFDADGASNLENFTDAKGVSDWALDAMKWAIKTELVNGTSETTLSPKATATRAQVAAILMRFCENVAK